MANCYFDFRHFRVYHDRCAMKVGTDGVLLGAWARMPGGCGRLLDVGTGSGLVALMMAQRHPAAAVVGIDIDEPSALQALENAAASPFADRVSILHGDAVGLQAAPFDAIVCNPPFFLSSLECPDDRRTLARHAVSLSYADLCRTAARLLSGGGLFSVIIPSECRSQFESQAYLNGLLPSRLCNVRTTPAKPPKRCLMEFRKNAAEERDTSEVCLQESPSQRSQWYHELTKDFYIR